MKTDSLALAFIQSKISIEDIATNQKILFKNIQKALKTKPDLILLPEFFLGGAKTIHDRENLSKIYQETLAQLKELAQKYSTAFYGSILEKSENKFYNASIYINSEGQNICDYRKIHLFSYDYEEKMVSAGLVAKNLMTPWGKVAPLICYDIRFPELLRHLVFDGATMAWVCAQWPKTRLHHWLTLLQARAIENQIYIFACNRIGTKKSLTYPGHSCIISPWGEIEFLLKENKQVGSYTVDLRKIAETRKRFPVLKDAVFK